MIDELTVRLGRVEVVLERNEETMLRIASSLEKLVVIETQFADHRASLERAFGAVRELQTELDDLADVIAVLKEKQPMIDAVLKAMGAVVLAGVIGFFGWIVTKVSA